MKTNVFQKKCKFNLTKAQSKLRFGRKGCKVIFIALLAAVLLMGCSEQKEDFRDVQFIPVGEWADDWGYGYNITNTSLEYYTSAWGEPGDVDYYPASKLTGNIDAAIDFSRNSGVLIIKITDEENMWLTVGNYTAVYYKDYKSNHVLLANPIDVDFNYIETNTLNQAINTFTVDNVGNHVTYWGSGYTK